MSHDKKCLKATNLVYTFHRPVQDPLESPICLFLQKTDRLLGTKFLKHFPEFKVHNLILNLQ